jgi:hypothetical protein
MSILLLTKLSTKIKLKIMKKNVLTILSLTIMLAFIAPLVTNAQGGKANFAGTWTYNAEKSTPPPAAPAGGGGGGGQGGGGGRGGFGGGNFVATQDANLLTVTRTRPGQNGGDPVTTVSKYTLDGKESVNTMGNSESKSVATWSADGKSLSIATTRQGQNGPTTSTQVWTLTAPKTLSIATTAPGRDGVTATRTAVYEIK